MTRAKRKAGGGCAWEHGGEGGKRVKRDAFVGAHGGVKLLPPVPPRPHRRAHAGTPFRPLMNYNPIRRRFLLARLRGRNAWKNSARGSLLRRSTQNETRRARLDVEVWTNIRRTDDSFYNKLKNFYGYLQA